MHGTAYYIEKYALGIVNANNSLQTYNKLLHNLRVKESLEQTIQKQFVHTPKVRVLDIGCGNAGALKDLKQWFGKKIETIGMNLVAFPKENADQQIIGNALEEKFPDNCHLIFSFRALHEIGHAQRMSITICKALAPKGIALLAFRLHNLAGETVEWAGDMQEKDEKFLLNIAERGRFQHCKVLGEAALDSNYPDKKIVKGIFIKIVKEG